MADIPEAAVTAACRAVQDQTDYKSDWPVRPRSDSPTFKEVVETALAAADPHIAAQALRDAAAELEAGPVATVFAHWLRLRADRLEADHG